MGIEVSGVRIVVVHVADIARSRHFYGELLGLTITTEAGDAVELDAGAGVTLRLHQSDADDVRARHGRIELHLGVADLERAVAYLAERGAPLLQEPDAGASGSRHAAILDPDGYPIFLTEVPAADAAPRPAKGEEHTAPLAPSGDATATQLLVESSDGRITVIGATGVDGVTPVDGDPEILDFGGGTLVRAEADVTVEVDPKSMVEVRADNHVRVESVYGGVRVRTGDGHVVLEGVAGGVSVVTGDGHVTGEDIAGDIQVRTGDGHIRLAGRLGVVELETGDGNVTVEGGTDRLGVVTGSGWVEATGDYSTVDVSTGDGQVQVEWCTGAAHINTGCGDITIAGSLIGDSKLRTGDGRVDVRLPHDSALAIDAHGEKVTSAFGQGEAQATDGTLFIRATRVRVNALEE